MAWCTIPVILRACSKCQFVVDVAHNEDDSDNKNDCGSDGHDSRDDTVNDEGSK